MGFAWHRHIYACHLTTHLYTSKSCAMIGSSDLPQPTDRHGSGPHSFKFRGVRCFFPNHLPPLLPECNFLVSEMPCP